MSPWSNGTTLVTVSLKRTGSGYTAKASLTITVAKVGLNGTGVGWSMTTDNDISGIVGCMQYPCSAFIGFTATTGSTATEHAIEQFSFVTAGLSATTSSSRSKSATRSGTAAATASSTRSKGFSVSPTLSPSSTLTGSTTGTTTPTSNLTASSSGTATAGSYPCGGLSAAFQSIRREVAMLLPAIQANASALTALSPLSDVLSYSVDASQWAGSMLASYGVTSAVSAKLAAAASALSTAAQLGGPDTDVTALLTSAQDAESASIAVSAALALVEQQQGLQAAIDVLTSGVPGADIDLPMLAQLLSDVLLTIDESTGSSVCTPQLGLIVDRMQRVTNAAALGASYLSTLYDGLQSAAMVSQGLSRFAASLVLPDAYASVPSFAAAISRLPSLVPNTSVSLPLVDLPLIFALSDKYATQPQVMSGTASTIAQIASWVSSIAGAPFTILKQLTADASSGSLRLTAAASISRFIDAAPSAMSGISAGMRSLTSLTSGGSATSDDIAQLTAAVNSMRWVCDGATTSLQPFVAAAAGLLDSIALELIPFLARVQPSLSSVDWSAAASSLQTARQMWIVVSKSEALVTRLGQERVAAVGALMSSIDSAVRQPMATLSTELMTLNVGELEVTIASLRALADVPSAACNASILLDRMLLWTAVPGGPSPALLQVMSDSAAGATTRLGRLSTVLSALPPTELLAQRTALLRVTSRLLEVPAALRTYASSIASLADASQLVISRAASTLSTLSDVVSALAVPSTVSAGPIGFYSDDASAIIALVAATPISTVVTAVGKLPAVSSAVSSALQSLAPALATAVSVSQRISQLASTCGAAGALTPVNGYSRFDSSYTGLNASLAAAGAQSLVSSIASAAGLFTSAISALNASTSSAATIDACNGQLRQAIVALQGSMDAAESLFTCMQSVTAAVDISQVSTRGAALGTVLSKLTVSLSGLLSNNGLCSALVQRLLSIPSVQVLVGDYSDALIAIMSALEAVASLSPVPAPPQASLASLSTVLRAKAVLKDVLGQATSTLAACRSFANQPLYASDLASPKDVAAQLVLHPLLALPSSLSDLSSANQSPFTSAAAAAAAISSAVASLDSAAPLLPLLAPYDFDATAASSGLSALHGVLVRMLPILVDVAAGVFPTALKDQASSVLASTEGLNLAVTSDDTAVTSALRLAQTSLSVLNTSRIITSLTTGPAYDGIGRALAAVPASLDVAGALLSSLGLNPSSVVNAAAQVQSVVNTSRALAPVLASTTQASLAIQSDLFGSFLGSLPTVRQLGAALGAAVTATTAAFVHAGASNSAALTFDEIRSFLATVRNVEDAVSGVPPQLAAVSSYSDLYAALQSSLGDDVASKIDELGYIRNFLQTLPDALPSLLSAAAASNSTSIFDALLVPATVPTLREEFSAYSSIISSVASAMALPASSSSIASLTTTMSSIASVRNSLGDFDSLSEAFAAFGYSYDAGASLDLARYTLSKVGQGLTSAATKGSDSLQQLSDGLTDAYSSLRQIAVSAVRGGGLGLSSRVNVSAAVQALTDLAPQGPALLSVLEEMLLLVPGLGDEVTYVLVETRDLPAVNITLKGAEVATVEVILRALPDGGEMAATAEAVSQELSIIRVDGRPELVAALVGTASQIASASGTTLQALSSGLTRLTLPMLTSDGQASITTSVTEDILPCAVTTVGVLSDAAAQLAKYGTPAWDDNDAYNAFVRVSEHRDDVLTGCAGITAVALSPVASLAAAFNSNGSSLADYLTAMSVFLPATGFDDANTTAVAQQLSALQALQPFTSLDPVLLRLAPSLSDTVTAVTTLLPAAKTIGAYAATELEYAAAVIVPDGDFGVLAQVPPAIIDAQAALDAAAQALYYFVFPDARTPEVNLTSTVRQAQLASIAAAQQLNGTLSVMADEGRVASSLNLSAEFASVTITAASAIQSTQAVAGTAQYTVPLAASILAQLQTGIASSPLATITGVLDGTSAVETSLWDAAGAFWATRGVDFNKTSSMIDCTANQFTALLANLSAISFLDSAYRAIVADAGFDSFDVASRAVDITPSLQYGSKAGRAATVDALSNLLSLATTALSRLSNATLLSDLSQRVDGTTAPVASLNPVILSLLISQDNVTIAYITARDKLAHFRAAATYLNSTTARYSDVIRLLAAVYSDLNSCGGWNVSDASTSVALSSLVAFMTGAPAYAPLANATAALAAAANLSAAASTSHVALMSVLPQLTSALSGPLAGTLALLSGLDSTVKVLIDALNTVTRFYSNSTSVVSPDAASALLRQIRAAVGQVSLDITALQTAPITDALSTVASFTAGLSAASRVNAQLRDQAAVADSLSASFSAVLVVKDTLVTQLTSYGLASGDILVNASVAYTSNVMALSLREGFTAALELDSLGPDAVQSSFTTAGASARGVTDIAPVLQSLSPQFAAATAGGVSAASFESLWSAMEDVSATLASDASPAVFAKVCADLSARGGANGSTAQAVLASGESLILLQTAVASVNASLTRLVAATAPVCSSIARLNLRSTLPSTVDLVASLATFSTGSENTVDTAVIMLRELAPLPGLQAVYGDLGTTASALAVYHNLSSAARAARKLTITPDEIGSVLSLEDRLCGASSVAAAVTASMTSLLTVQSAYQGSSVNPRSFRASTVTLAGLVSNASASLSRQAAWLSNETAVSAGWGGLRQATSALAALQGVALYAPNASVLSSALFSSASTILGLPAAAFVAIGSPSDAVMSLLRAAATARRIGRASQWVQSAYSGAVSASSIRDVWCMLSQWNAAGGDIRTPTATSTRSYSGSSTARAYGASASLTGSRTAAATRSGTQTGSLTGTRTLTGTGTSSWTKSAGSTSSVTRSGSSTPPVTASLTLNRSPSSTATQSRTSSNTGTATGTTRSASISVSISLSASATWTRSVTGSSLSTATATSTSSSSRRLTPFSTLTSTPLPSIRPPPIECPADVPPLSGPLLLQLVERAFGGLNSLQDQIEQTPTYPARMSSPALQSALQDSSDALSGLAALAQARNRLAILGALMDAALAMYADQLPAYANIRYDAYDLATYLKSTTATVGLPSITSDAVTIPLALSSPVLLDSLSRSAGLVALAPTLGRLAADLPRPDVGALTRLSSAVSRGQALVSVVSSVAQQADTIAQASGAMRAATSAFSGSAFNAKESADVLLALSRFRVSLPKLSSLMATVRSKVSSNTSALTDPARELVTAVDTAVRFVGPQFALVPPSLSKVSSLIGALSSFTYTGLSQLAFSLQSSLTAIAGFASDPSVLAAGLTREAYVASSIARNISGAPRLLTSISSLVSIQVSPSDIEPITAVSNSVLSLSKLSSIVNTLSDLLANSSAIRAALESAQGLPSVAVGGQAYYKATLSAVSNSLSSLTSPALTAQDALTSLQQYLQTTTATGTAKLNGVIKLLGATVDAFPGLTGTYPQAEVWNLLTSAVIDKSLSAGASAVADTADAVADTLSWLLSTSSTQAQGSLGVSSSLVYLLGDSAAVGLSDTLAATSSLLRLVNATAKGLIDSPLRIQQLREGTDALLSVQTNVGNLRQIAGRQLVTTPAVLTKAFDTFDVSDSTASLLFAPSQTYFDVLSGINATVTLFRPLISLLSDSVGTCSNAIQTSPAFASTTKAAGTLKSPDALQCIAMASAGNLSAAASDIVTITTGSGKSAQTTKLDVSRCPPASSLMNLGLDMASLFPALAPASALVQYSTLSSQSGLYGQVAKVLSPSSPSTAPILGLGFCFAPTVTSGPCVVLRRVLTAISQSIAERIELAEIGATFTVPTLATMFGPQLRNVTAFLRDRALPDLTSFYSSASSLSSSVLGTVTTALAAANGTARRLSSAGDDQIDSVELSYLHYAPGMAAVLSSRHLSQAPSSEGEEAEDAAAMRERLLWVDMGIAGLSNPNRRLAGGRRLQAQSDAMQALLSVVNGFVSSADGRFASLTLALGPQAPFESVAAAADAAAAAAGPAQAALALIPAWISKLTNAADLAPTVLSYLAQSEAVRSVGAAMFPIITDFQRSLAFLRDPTVRSASQLSDAVTLVAATAALGYNMSATWRNLSVAITQETLDMYIHARGGFTPKELAPYDSQKWCNTSAGSVCLHQIVRAPPKYLAHELPNKLMQVCNSLSIFLFPAKLLT